LGRAESIWAYKPEPIGADNCLEVHVGDDDLQRAFELIARYKLGEIPPGIVVDDAQIGLLRLLCADLLPDEKFSLDGMDILVLKIAKADTKWNKECQIAISTIYDLRLAGKNNEAEQARNAFVSACPSSWYQEIIESV